MPRQPRMDAPGALHHIMGRGIERTKIFRIDADREDFLNRLAGLCKEGNLIVFAWCLMQNHFHLLVRTGRQSISKSMKSFLRDMLSISTFDIKDTAISFRIDINP